LRFSIIVPVYNTEKYLKECIESVLIQSISDWELILVDDGSTDSSLEIISDYANRDKRIKVIPKDNEGQLFARRTGFAAATGDYILCIDSDDYWEPNCLSVLSENIEKYTPDVILFACEKVDNSGNKNGTIAVFTKDVELVEKEALYKQILSSDMLNSMSLKAFKRDLLENDQTDYSAFRKKSFGEDKLQTLHILTKAESVLSIPYALYNYRKHQENVSNSINLDSISDIIGNDLFIILFEYMKKWGLCDKGSIRSYNTYYLHNYIYAVYNLRKKCIQNGQRKEFRKRLTRSLLLSDIKIFSNNDLSFKEKLKAALATYFTCIL